MAEQPDANEKGCLREQDPTLHAEASPPALASRKWGCPSIDEKLSERGAGAPAPKQAWSVALAEARACGGSYAARSTGFLRLAAWSIELHVSFSRQISQLQQKSCMPAIPTERRRTMFLLTLHAQSTITMAKIAASFLLLSACTHQSWAFVSSAAHSHRAPPQYEFQLAARRHDNHNDESHPSFLQQSMQVMTTASLGLVLASSCLFSVAPAFAETKNYDGFAEYAKDNQMEKSDVSCFMNKCGDQTKALFSNPRGIKGVSCLGRCKGEQSCAMRCFAEYGSDDLNNWLSVPFEDNECVKVPKNIDNSAEIIGYDYSSEKVWSFDTCWKMVQDGWTQSQLWLVWLSNQHLWKEWQWR